MVPALPVCCGAGAPSCGPGPPAATATEVTGAGDTFAGTFLAHWLDGLPSRQVLTSAVHAATEHLGAPPVPIPAQFRS
ncbi:PfkB family carbohydrate kinase [Streptomyces achromogenes]|uniref:PfkB family carbohydrate kinase n=1 Tax=Streptomyces achromogenes TaxID=67255 RepID=UPI0036B9DD1E